MTDEQLEPQSDDQTQIEGSAETAPDSPSKKSLFSNPIVLAVLAVVLIGASVGITMMMMGGDDPVAEPAAAENESAGSHQSDEHASAEHQPATQDDNAPHESSVHESHGEKPAKVQGDDKFAGMYHEDETEIGDDSYEEFSIEDDPDVMDDIMANLEFLDYEPEPAMEGEAESDEPGMSREDSMAARKWLDEENAKLDAREKKLTARQKELELLDKKISQKLLKLEQAESARVASLAKLYDNMDPRSVAKLMANLDDETVVSILPRMKQKNASQVLALFPAKRGARLSKQMITIAGN